jgi:7-cyano-7-deazaguanine synthase
MAPTPKACALVSGGLESTLLLQIALQQGREVYPLYVACGFFWEEQEIDSLKKFLNKFSRPELKNLTIQQKPLRDIFPDLWAYHPERFPDQNSPLGSVYLPGRNLILLLQGSLLAQRYDLQEIWIGVLGKNPYPDATRSFFDAFELLHSQTFKNSIKVQAPFQSLRKGELIGKFPDFPYQLNVTCLRPQGYLHCGNCYKCAERRRAFREASIPDPTEYLVAP